MESCLHSQKLSRKTVESLSKQPIPRPDAPELETSEIKLVASFEDSCSSNAKQQTLPAAPRYPQKLLLPKPKVALVKLPVMQFSPVPVFVPTADSSAQPVVLGVDHQGSAPGAVHLLPLSIGTPWVGPHAERPRFPGPLLRRTRGMGNSHNSKPLSKIQKDIYKVFSPDSLKDK